MNSCKDFEQINFSPFNFFNDQGQEDMTDPDLNYFNDLNSNYFDAGISQKKMLKDTFAI